MRALNLASDLQLFELLATLCFLYFLILTVHIQVDKLQVLCICNQRSFVWGDLGRMKFEWVRLFVCCTFDCGPRHQTTDMALSRHRFQVKEIARGPVVRCHKLRIICQGIWHALRQFGGTIPDAKPLWRWWWTQSGHLAGAAYRLPKLAALSFGKILRLHAKSYTQHNIYNTYIYTYHKTKFQHQEVDGW